jgi:hypothetical protein
MSSPSFDCIDYHSRPELASYSEPEFPVFNLQPVEREFLPALNINIPACFQRETPEDQQLGQPRKQQQYHSFRIGLRLRPDKKTRAPEFVQ